MTPLHGLLFLCEFLIPGILLSLMYASRTAEWSYRVFIGTLFLVGTVLPASVALVASSSLSSQNYAALIVFPFDAGQWTWQMAVLGCCVTRSVWWEGGLWNYMLMWITAWMWLGGLVFVGREVFQIVDCTAESDKENYQLFAWLLADRQSCLHFSWRVGRAVLDSVWIVLVTPTLANHVWGFPVQYHHGYAPLLTLVLSVVLRVVRWNKPESTLCVGLDRWSFMVLVGQLVLGVKRSPVVPLPPTVEIMSTTRTPEQDWAPIPTQEPLTRDDPEA